MPPIPTPPVPARSVRPMAIIPYEDYEALLEQVEYNTRVEERFRAGRNGTDAVEVFLSVFDPSRANDKAHLAYCLDETLDRLKELEQ